MTPQEHWLVPERPFDSYGEYLGAVGGAALVRVALPQLAFPPARKASGDVSVRIAADLAAAFARLAEGANTDLNPEVYVALREWLAS